MASRASPHASARCRPTSSASSRRSKPFPPARSPPMTRADNTRYLARAAAERHQATLERASDAIERLDRTGQPVTFSAVAAAAGVSRAWLYRHPGIRDLISSLRSSSPATSSPAAQRATAESLRARLDAARDEI